MTVTINGAGTITGLTTADVPQVNVSTKILVGATTSTFNQGLQLYGSASPTQQASMIQWRYAADATGPTLLMVKTRGATATAVDLVANDDQVGQVAWQASNGVVANNSLAKIEAKIGPSAAWGATSATSLPTNLGFSTTPTGAVNASTRMLIDPDGAVNVYANVRVNQLSAIPTGGSQLQGLNFSSVANFGVFYGSGVPTLSAAQGSLYLRSDGSSTSTRMYVNTNGSTTWTAVTTVA